MQTLYLSITDGNSVEKRDRRKLTSSRLNILRTMSSPVSLTGLAHGVSGVTNSLVGYRHVSSSDVGRESNLAPVVDETADAKQCTSMQINGDSNRAGRRRNFPAYVATNLSLRTIQVHGSSNYSQMRSLHDDWSYILHYVIRSAFQISRCNYEY